MVLGSITITDLGNGTAQVERNSTFGLRSQILPVTKAAVDAWMASGTLVQDAFPDLTDDQREFLLTGTYFAYGADKRPDVRAHTVFDAILSGERTSTTRYPGWPSYAGWERTRPGALIHFFEDRAMQGRSVVVRVTDVRAIDFALMDEDELEAWSRAEGWSVAYAKRKRADAKTRALWIRYERVDAA